MEIRRDVFRPEDIALDETLFHVANGYLGLRACLEESVPQGMRSVRGTYVNGFHDTRLLQYEERLYGFAHTQQSMANVPDAQGVAISLDGEQFSMFEGKLQAFSRILDMGAGMYTRNVTWVSPGGRATRLLFSRLASFDERSLAVIHVEITPLDWSGSISVTSTLRGDVRQDADPNDPRKANEGEALLTVTRTDTVGGALCMEARAKRSGLMVACAAAHRSDGFAIEEAVSGNPVSECKFACASERGKTVSITKYVAYADSRLYDDPWVHVMETAHNAVSYAFYYWKDKQASFLAAFWKQADTGVSGNPELDRGLRYSMFCLLQSAGRDGVGNISSKGLSGEGYEGHYFWDTEIYMFPFFLLMDPAQARKLLDSRVKMLPEAILHAREMGHGKGALYAWRTITGSECSAQYHINGAVAHAFLSYYMATRDQEYMAKTGAQVLVQTARLWMDAGHWLGNEFRIDSVTGPDEYSCVVNNNYYTNRCAQQNLHGAARVCRDLIREGILVEVSEEELAGFEQAAGAMFLPFDESLGVCAQDDAFLRKERLDLSRIPPERFPLLLHHHPLFLYRHQVCKQADTVLSHFLFEDGEDEGVIRRTYDYYEPLTTHDSSLSQCVFSMMPARTGQPKKALRYYGQSASLDLLNTHGNTPDGIHAANTGGCWMGIVFGFGGLRLKEEGLLLRPCLPEGMEGYHFTLTWRGTACARRWTTAPYASRNCAARTGTYGYMRKATC